MTGTPISGSDDVTMADSPKFKRMPGPLEKKPPTGDPSAEMPPATSGPIQIDPTLLAGHDCVPGQPYTITLDVTAGDSPGTFDVSGVQSVAPPASAGETEGMGDMAKEPDNELAGEPSLEGGAPVVPADEEEQILGYKRPQRSPKAAPSFDIQSLRS